MTNNNPAQLAMNNRYADATCNELAESMFQPGKDAAAIVDAACNVSTSINTSLKQMRDSAIVADD